MFIGHYAVAFASKQAAPRVSLGTLFLAVQFLDLLWPLLLLLGVEHVRIDPGNTAFTPLDFFDYPISHSLVSTLAYSITFGLLYYFVKHDRAGAWVLACGVCSHWLLDFITHRPDLPFAPWSKEYVGLGLWQSVGWTIGIEATLFVITAGLYLRTTVAIDRAGTFAFWSLIVFFVFSYLGNILAPPPPNVTAIAIGTFLLWLTVPWGYWIDRHRRSR
jgi:membrane-bound metal-dependent hydrolase YbcI (DUF457 family)